MLLNKSGFFTNRGCNLADRLYNRGMNETQYDDFTATIQCDEADEPTQEDWAEFAEYCDSMDEKYSDEFVEIDLTTGVHLVK